MIHRWWTHFAAQTRACHFGAALLCRGLRVRRERAREVYVTGDEGAKREAVEMLRAGRQPNEPPRGEPSPQVALMEEAEESLA